MKSTLRLSTSFNTLLRTLPLLAIALLLASCNQDDDGMVTQEAITDEEAVAIVEGALLSGSEGITQEAEDAAMTAEKYLEKDPDNFCGQTSDSTVTRSIDQPRLTANYNTSWLWTVNCNDFNIPVSLDFARTAEGNYETQRIIASDNADSEWLLDNLLFGSSYSLSGMYSRSGSYTSKIREQNTLTTQLDLTVADLSINKLNYRIESGSASFILSGVATNGATFELPGQITFLGNGQATVTINGNTFEIEL